MADKRRIVSLLPSATEIVAFLGLTGELVGRSHECDYPLEVQHLPICTEPKLDPSGSSAAIHAQVTDVLQAALSVYRVYDDLLLQLQPTHIVTQAQCDVCAVSLRDVEEAISRLADIQPQIISLQPMVLTDIWSDIQRVAEALGVEAPLERLQQRLADCQTRAETLTSRPTVVCIEWIEPLMAAGNWVPELVAIAGGQSCFGTVGKHSPWLSWEALQQADPDVLVIMPCGFDLERTRQEAQTLTQHPYWASLKAVQTGQVFLTDGNQYFNRPGPRLVDSLEILAEIFHPDEFGDRYRGHGWQPL
ncbi:MULTISPECIES: cobalamin-binding protein [unclassified Leptolyngbya]|uniref:cobalamin-binding protein n=1 Tax=unclassified Leptolyngbya TaxID=2650499 RepID=UPI0016826289|nr:MULTISPECIES: cobalamin-binding protein [unclassified Leptolyngbya]MBD1910977.1 cobalamin-binding protein [Leptolyngbya sp. FACHB-8]MBD2158356.1 cobalamin-binding protein [Leptolyngbya sp. FACHB-16]